MKLILYHAWVSSASRKVRLALAEKGLAYESRPMDLSRFEHHENWYKALNPSGIVPALLIDGRPLVESNFINEWLDETFGDPPLMPANPFDRHDLRLWAKYIDDHCLPAVQKHNWMQLFHPFAREWSDIELEERLSVIPTEERRATWRRMARQPFSAAELEAALDILRGMMDRIEGRLQTRDWLVGDAFGLADIAAAPYVVRFFEIAPGEPGQRPRADAWWARMRARPSFAAAVMEPFA
ncbi:MAG: glutathione S-transferase family protein [Pseudomonadota bacterium]